MSMTNMIRPILAHLTVSSVIGHFYFLCFIGEGNPFIDDTGRTWQVSDTGFESLIFSICSDIDPTPH